MRQHKHRFFGTTIVGAKGQVVIPKEAREAMNLTQGEKLLVFGGRGHMIGFMKLDGARRVLKAMSDHFDKLKNLVEDDNE